ncbi:hypothetical protein [Sphingomonas aquatilis]
MMTGTRAVTATNSAPRIPCRLSVRSADYDHVLGSSLTVRVDGVEQRNVISYDVDAGVVRRYREVAGHYVFDPDTEDAVEEDVHGTVTVTPRG